MFLYIHVYVIEWTAIDWYWKYDDQLKY